MTSQFYDTTRPGGPREKSWYAAEHGFLRPGDHVTYDNTVGPAGLTGEHVITELIDLGDSDHTVTAILDGGTWEVQANNLRREETNGRPYRLHDA